MVYRCKTTDATFKNKERSKIHVWTPLRGMMALEAPSTQLMGLSLAAFSSLAKTTIEIFLFGTQQFEDDIKCVQSGLRNALAQKQRYNNE